MLLKKMQPLTFDGNNHVSLKVTNCSDELRWSEDVNRGHEVVVLLLVGGWNPLYPTNAVGEVLREWAGEVPALLAASLSSRAESDLESCVGDDGRE